SMESACARGSGIATPMTSVATASRTNAAVRSRPSPEAPTSISAWELCGRFRNAGHPFDASWINDIRVNLSAAEHRITTLRGRRSVKKDAQAAWLLKAITCIDLTTLNG